MKITLKDGSVKEYENSLSVIDIAADISEGLARNACAGEVDGEVVDLRTVVDRDCNLSILTVNDPAGLAAYRHTASHILPQGINANPSFSREDLDKIEAEMKKIIKEGHKLERFTLPKEEAIALMKEKGEPYKVELIEDLPEGEEISFYSQGDFTDLCAGPHLMSTKPIKAFKLTSSSGAYWRGSEKNAMLSRIYGTAFAKKDELNEYLEYLANIKNRDHNKLGRELEIFATVDVIGQGLPLLMPKGLRPKIPGLSPCLGIT